MQWNTVHKSQKFTPYQEAQHFKTELITLENAEIKTGESRIDLIMIRCDEQGFT